MLGCMIRVLCWGVRLGFYVGLYDYGSMLGCKIRVLCWAV